MAAPGVVVDVFGFSPASDDQICVTAREFARTEDLMVLDTIATGSGVLVVREPRRVTVLTDLAAWAEDRPYRRVAAVPAGGALVIDRGGGRWWFVETYRWARLVSTRVLNGWLRR